MFPPPKKVQKTTFQKPTNLPKEFFFEKLFCLGNSEKDERHHKNRIEKEEKRDNTTNAKKIKGQLKNRKEFLLKIKMEQKSRGDKRSFVSLQENIFFEWDFFKKTFFER